MTDHHNNENLVSVIIPCYNVSNTITETVQSVLNQSYSNIEIILVNDGSTDDLHKTITPLLTINNTIIYHEQQNTGPSASRNVGSKLSKGQYLVFLDGDDLLEGSFIEQCLKQFLDNHDTHLVYTDTMQFEATNEILKLQKYSYRSILMKNCITVTAMIRRDCFEIVGMYDENLRFNEDWELWIRYLHRYPNVSKIDKPLFYYRRRLSKDSATDLNDIKNISDRAILYIYNKHYERYRQYGYKITYIMSLIFREKKYYNKWYRKLWYSLFMPRKYKKKTELFP